MNTSSASRTVRSTSRLKVPCKRLLLISAFYDSFKDKDYMKRVTASLFNFIDVNNDGKVTFESFLTKFYPDFKEKELQKIKKWVSDSGNPRDAARTKHDRVRARVEQGTEN